MKKIPIIIDCDPGVDDALAIMLALNEPQFDVKAICSVTGNGTIKTTTSNAIKVLALCGREEIPVYRGSECSVDEKIPDTVSAFGDDGLGGYAHTIITNKKEEDLDAVSYLLDTVKKSPKELTIFALGPCTNLAHAIRKDKSFAGNVKELIIMGGAKFTGNMSPVAEYNFWADPIAADEVLNAGFNNVTLIGLDVTNKIALSSDIREVLKIMNTSLSTFIYNITQEGVNENWQVRKKPVAPMHDVLTIAYYMNKSILTIRPSQVNVITEGIGRGQSVVDYDGHWSEGKCNTNFATEVDQNKFYEIFLSTLFPKYEKILVDYLQKNKL